MTNVYNIFFRKPERKRELGIPMLAWGGGGGGGGEDYIKISLKWGLGVDWVYLNQVRARCPALLNML
jgi:hypothetical protein